MIIYRISDAGGGRCKAPGEAGKNSAARIFWRGNRPEPARQPEFFRRREGNHQQPIAGFEDVDQRTLNIQVAMIYASPKLNELTSLKILRTTFGVRKISLKSGGPFGSGGHCSPSHSSTANSRGRKCAKTVRRSELADHSTGSVIAGVVVVMALRR
jgi:hypothetical protein